MILAGDIGGTKTVLAIVSSEAGPRAPLAEQTFPSGRYPSLEAVVKEFLDQAGHPVRRAIFGVAGPVVAGRAATTNLPWILDEKQLEKALGVASVCLLNDLNALAHAIPWLEPADLHTLSAGEPTPGGAIAVIAPGTGLGEAFLTWDGTRYRTHSSEGGHADFAPADTLQLELLRYLQDRHDHVSYERVCSGRGLPNIYAFLKDRYTYQEPAWLADQLAVAEDPTPVIVNGALNKARPCELCTQTLHMFVSILGAEAGNLALKVMATGGVYLGGGIPPRILPTLTGRRLMESFAGKGRFSDLLARVPVHVIMNSNAALLGAACHGLGL